jgi:hypothetical protein
VRIDFAIPCTDAELTPDDTVHIQHAGQRLLWVEKLPGTITYPVVIGLKAAEHEITFGQEYEISGRVLGPDLTEVGHANAGRFQAEQSPSTPPGAEWNRLVIWTCVFEAAAEGGYTIEVAIEGRRVSVPVWIYQGPARPIR